MRHKFPAVSRKFLTAEKFFFHHRENYGPQVKNASDNVNKNSLDFPDGRPYLLAFAQLSFSETVRLKTSLSGMESGSTLK